MKHKLSATVCILFFLLLGALGYGYNVVQAQLTLDPCTVYKNPVTLEEHFGSFFTDTASFVGWLPDRRVCSGAASGEETFVESSNFLPFDVTVKNENAAGTDFFIPYRTLPELHSFLRAVDSNQGTNSPLADLSVCIVGEENTTNEVVDTGIGKNGLPYLVTLLGCDAPDTPPNACSALTSFTDPRDGTVYNVQSAGDACWLAEDYNYWWELLQDLWDLDTDNDNTIFYDIAAGSYTDGATIPVQLKNICDAFKPNTIAGFATLKSFYYEAGSSELMACEYGNGNTYERDNLPELQDGNDYNGIVIGDNLYDYDSDDDDFLNNELCPTGWHLPSEAELLAASNDLSLTNDGVFLDPTNKVKYSTGASNYFAWGASYNGYASNYAVFNGLPTGQAIAGHTRCVKD